MFPCFRRFVVCVVLATAGPALSEEVVARVLGEPIARADLAAAATEHNRERMTPEDFAEWREDSLSKTLFRLVRNPLIKAYAERAGLEPTEAEISRSAERLGSAGAGGEPESPRKDRFAREWAARTLRELNVGEALWRKHGGAVGFGSLGSCTPFEAGVAFFRGEVEAGRLEFVAPDVEERFWKTADNRRLLADVVVEDPAKVAHYFEKLRAAWSDSAGDERRAELPPE